jgi:hypothetical protein
VKSFFEEFAQFQLVNISPKRSKAVISGEAVTPRATPGQSTPTAVEPRNSVPRRGLTSEPADFWQRE